MFPKNILHFPLAHKYTLPWWGFLEWSIFPPPSLQEHTCTLVLVQMYYHSYISPYCAAALVPHMYAHAACSFGHVDEGSRLKRAKAKWVFSGLQLYPLSAGRQNYSVGTPRNPNLTLPAQPISTGNKAKPFRQIWNKHIQTFCLSHLGTANGFSSYRRLKIYAYLHQHPLSLSQYYIHFANHKVLRYLPLLSSRN